jgi:hypothetical protein
VENPPRQSAPLQPPKFWFVFHWRLIVSFVALAVVAFAACDLINAKVDAKVAQWSGAADTTPRPSNWTQGYEAELDLTLITKDADRLACADDAEYEGSYCEFKEGKQRRKSDHGQPMDDNRIHVIQPYRTALGNNLVLVAGLWATPALATRRHLEPARGVPDKDLRRFIARCKLKFIGEMQNVEVRWDYNQQWYNEAKAPLARAEWCEVLEN